jgi:molybdopterin molybdotransferase
VPDPSTTARVKPPWSLRTADQAYEAIGALPPLPTETVTARDALGRVLAEDVAAVDDIPHFLRSNMDGYAVRAADTFGADESRSVRLLLAAEVAMGAEATTPCAPGQAVRVSTGGMMPPGADAVVIVERTEERRRGDGAVDVLVRAGVVPGQNTVAVGEDLRSGDLVFRAGHRLRAGDVGALCGIGRTEVLVHRRARVAVMATGDEIVEPDAPLPPGKVRNINQYLLASMGRALGCEVLDLGVVPDDEAALRAALTRATSETDAVFLSGGSSMGTRDLTLAAIEALPDGALVFHGIAIAPGKPTILARAGAAAIMGVPGNPAAAAVVFTLFGSALVRVLEGEKIDRILRNRPRLRARLAESVTSTPGREDYVRVRLEDGDGNDRATLPQAVPLRGKSVAISTIARADGLLRIPASTEGIDAGQEVDVWLL